MQEFFFQRRLFFAHQIKLSEGKMTQDFETLIPHPGGQKKKIQKLPWLWTTDFGTAFGIPIIWMVFKELPWFTYRSIFLQFYSTFLRFNYRKLNYFPSFSAHSRQQYPHAQQQFTTFRQDPPPPPTYRQEPPPPPPPQKPLKQQENYNRSAVSWNANPHGHTQTTTRASHQTVPYGGGYGQPQGYTTTDSYNYQMTAVSDFWVSSSFIPIRIISWLYRCPGASIGCKLRYV